MFCANCGKELDNKAVVCVYCGVATQNMPPSNQQYQRPISTPPQNQQPIIINNTAKSYAFGGRVPRKRSCLFDGIMICVTGGLWIIWMIFRPKY